jgi:type I restriction enzyme, S subunit
VSFPQQHSQIRLKFVATINDQALSENVDPDFEIAYIDIGNVDSTGTIHEIVNHRFEAAPSRARRIVQDGDVIVSTVRTYLQAIAPIIAPPENLIVSTGFAVIRPLADQFDAGFCRYALREPRFLTEIEMRSTGVSYPAINASEIGDIIVSMPPLADQVSIAAFLDAQLSQIDTLIEAKQQLLGSLTEKRRMVVAEAVMCGLDRTSPLRPSGIDWLGDIPAHWEVRRSKWLFEERDVRSVTGEETLYSLRMDRGLIPHNEVSEKQTRSEELVGYKQARQGELVINRMRAATGLIAIASGDGLVSPDYAVFVPSAEIQTDYYVELFKTTLLQAVFRSESTGLGNGSQGFLRLYSENFLALWFPFPPLIEQRKIASHIAQERSKIDTLASATHQSIALLKERRSALIAAAVTGQIDIAEAA